MQVPEFISKGLGQVKSFWGSLSNTRRIAGAAALVAVVGLLAYASWPREERFATVFSGLSTEDGAKMTTFLKKNKTRFKLVSGGTAIAVPEAKVHQTRLDLAGAGLPRGGGVGFEIFDNQKFGISDFAQQINYRRAMQGELERTITEIDAVKTARVHVALPGRQLFARKKKEVSASVTLRIYPGRILGAASVNAIVHLVSSSVAGLGAKSITIVDTQGALLWGGDKGDLLGPGGVLAYRGKLESKLQRRVSEILDTALGRKRSVVKVAAEVELSQEEQTDEQYDPDKLAIRSESKSEEKETKAKEKASGVPGVRGNLPGGKKADDKDKSGSSRKRYTRNYEVNKTLRRRMSPAGAIRRLTVAVLVDARLIVGPEAAKKAASPTGKPAKKDEAITLAMTKVVGAGPTPEITKIDLERLEQLVKQTVGFNPARGDVVTLKAVPFASSRPRVVTIVPTLWSKLMPYKWIILGGMGGLMVMLGVVIFLLIRKKRAKKDEEQNLELPKTVKQLEADASSALDAELESAMPPTRQLAYAATERDSIRAAQVLRAWIAEG
jgi:flagellar M-ring protein FliF